MDATEKMILAAIDSHADALISFAEDLYTHAEPGFRETRTAQKIAALFEQLGLETRRGYAITGVKAYLSCGNTPSVTVAALGELDGITCPRHPYANPENGLSHACGHHIQLTALAGAAMALSQPEIREALDGRIAFFAVPSEEYTDLDYKLNLIKEKKIKYGGGKSELIRTGAFDDINLCVTHHLHMVDTTADLLLGFHPTNGFIAKRIVIKGKASHAAIAPHKGVNALNAANIGLNALSYQRETFQDKDHVRIHAIIAQGGNIVNVIPDRVVVEAQVRAQNMTAMLDANQKVNRSFEAGAHAVGAQVEIIDSPGYLPVLDTPIAPALFEAGQALSPSFKVDRINHTVHNPASTDVGDLSHLMPVVGFTTGGFTGTLHGADFEITDKNKAYILPAKAMALTLYHLLKEDAKQAISLMESFPQHLTKQEYLEYMDSFDTIQQS